MMAINKYYNPTDHLLIMLEKYKKFPDRQIQAILLELAFSYWKILFQLHQALLYFLKAIELDPESTYLTVRTYFMCFSL